MTENPESKRARQRKASNQFERDKRQRQREGREAVGPEMAKVLRDEILPPDARKGDDDDRAFGLDYIDSEEDEG